MKKVFEVTVSADFKNDKAAALRCKKKLEEATAKLSEKYEVVVELREWQIS